MKCAAQSSQRPLRRPFGAAAVTASRPRAGWRRGGLLPVARIFGRSTSGKRCSSVWNSPPGHDRDLELGAGDDARRAERSTDEPDLAEEVAGPEHGDVLAVARDVGDAVDESRRTRARARPAVRAPAPGGTMSRSVTRATSSTRRRGTGPEERGVLNIARMHGALLRQLVRSVVLYARVYDRSC